MNDWKTTKDARMNITNGPPPDDERLDDDIDLF